MKQNIVVITTRGITAKPNRSLIEQMTFLKEFENDYNLILIHAGKTDAGAKHISSVTGLRFSKVIGLRQHYCDSVIPLKYKTWMDYIDALDKMEENSKVTNLTDVAAVFCFGGLLSAGTGLQREKNKLDVVLSSQRQMNFMSVGSVITVVLNGYYLSNKFNCPYNEIIYDPQECSVGLSKLLKFPKLSLWFGYGYKQDGLTVSRADLLQYYLKRQPTFSSNEQKKIYDVTFGMTVLTKDRISTYENVLESMTNLDRFFVRNKYTGEDTFVDRETYLDYIRQSRYTYITPSYDIGHFSIFRFIEAVYNNCLPLISRECDLTFFKETFRFDPVLLAHFVVDIGDNLVYSDDLIETLLLEAKRVLFENPVLPLHEMISL